MRLLSLTLENIGPFDTAELSFLDGPEDEVPVTSRDAPDPQPW